MRFVQIQHSNTVHQATALFEAMGTGVSQEQLH